MKKILILSLLIWTTNFAFSQNPVVQSILNDVRIDSITYFVKQLSGEEQVIIGGMPDTIFSRQVFQPGNEKTFQFVKEKFQVYGLLIDSLQFDSDGKNLMGIKTGTQFPGKKFILGAHYDNVGNFIAPGADDNASGSAAVIEAARVFSEYDFPFTIVFALWDEEELGLVGSTAYASFAGGNDEEILGYINMDMLGWDGNNDLIADLHVRDVALSTELASKAINANAIYNIDLTIHLVNPGSGNTDHASFWNNGFTAIGINEEYDNDFNPFWHTSADSLGQFNLLFYEKCTKLAYATLADCAIDSVNTLSINRQVTSAENEKFKVFPMPVKDKLTIEFVEPQVKDLIVTVYDVGGQLIRTYFTNGGNQILLDVEKITPGMYFLEIRQDQNLIGIRKWIKG